jgi:hypothetical protein
MTQNTETEKKGSDRIKLPFTFDADKIQAEYEALKLLKFEYYSVLPLRAPAHLVDSSLPFPPPSGDYADGSWTNWLDTDELQSSPYLMSVVNGFQEHTTVNLVRLLRLAPGAVVAEHTDPTLALEEEKSMIRLTIPVSGNDNVDFFLNGTTIPMEPGECWYLRLSDPHKIDHHGETERVNLTIDMIPNEWIRNVIAEAELQEA